MTFLPDGDNEGMKFIIGYDIQKCVIITLRLLLKTKNNYLINIFRNFDKIDGIGEV